MEIFRLRDTQESAPKTVQHEGDPQEKSESESGETEQESKDVNLKYERLVSVDKDAAASVPCKVLERLQLETATSTEKILRSFYLSRKVKRSTRAAIMKITWST